VRGNTSNTRKVLSKDGRWAQVFWRVISGGAAFSRSDVERVARGVFGKDYDPKEIRRVIGELVKNGVLRIYPSGKGETRYFITEDLMEAILDAIGQTTLDNFPASTYTESLDDVQRELERVDELTLPQFYRLLEEMGIDTAKILREVLAVHEFAEQNPKELLMEMLEDCIEKHNEAYKRYLNETSEKGRRALMTIMNRLRAIIRSVYERYLQIPIGTPRESGRYPIRMPDEGEIGEIVLEDAGVVGELLEKRITDDKMIVDYEPIGGDYFDGVDSSVHEVRPRIGRYVPGFSVFTVVSVTLGCDAEENRPPYVKPRPEEVATERLSDLERKGYVTRGSELLRFSDYYIDRIKEANMQRIQYGFINETLRGVRQDGLPQPQIVYLDGRVWPTEHKLSDFFAEHRNYVLQALSEFVEIVKWMRGDGPKVVGVVKRGHLGFLWYLVFWYAYRKGVVSFEKFVLEPNMYESLENKDGAVALWLLMTYYGLTGKYGRLFAVRRKLYAADPEITKIFMRVHSERDRGLSIAEIEDDPAFWKEVVEEAIVRRKYGDLMRTIERLLEGDISWDNLHIDLRRNLKPKLEVLDDESRRKLMRNLRRCALEKEKCEILKREIGFDVLNRQDGQLMHDLSTAYAFGDVVSLYFLPPESYHEAFVEMFTSEDSGFQPGSSPYFALPRIDVLLPVLSWRIFGDVERSVITKYIDEILVRPGEKFYVQYGTSEGVVWNLIVPSPVKLAHIYSKDIVRKEVAPKYAAILTMFISKLREELESES